MEQDIYDPAFVADLFDKCSVRYRKWSAVSSFGFVVRWRKDCVKAIPTPIADNAQVVDLMAGTGEVWPHLLKAHPGLGAITAIDISRTMHDEALARLHQSRSHKITHIAANVLETDLPDEIADVVVSTFGLKTFNPKQLNILAAQIARILKRGGSFSVIEASDPTGWILRPLYRIYMDLILPQIERLFLNGAQDFSMIGTYTREFGNTHLFADALRAQGLDAVETKYFFGCAWGVSGTKPAL